jgi:manganese transport protein
MEILAYLGPGLLVAVGFIDPGNWASNVAAGSMYGYTLLWMVTLSTLMLIILQHNAAHLGIATGLCLAEAVTKHVRPWIGRGLLTSAMLAAVATAVAELLGGAIALRILFRIPLRIGTLMIVAIVVLFLFGQSYRAIERWIFGFVALIGVAFLCELVMLDVDWRASAISWVLPRIPTGSMPIVMSVLGAVVMPHNLFLHSEIIQSRQWQLQDAAAIRHKLKYEMVDTATSMGIGWAINSAMILVAAAVFCAHGYAVTELEQAGQLLRPLLGRFAALAFAIALLCAGISSSVTAGMASGTIFAGMFGEPYNVHDRHSRIGIALGLGAATAVIFFITNPFKGLVISQICLSVQLPWTIFTQIYLTSSRNVMGVYANTPLGSILLWSVGLVVAMLNVLLLQSLLRG